MRQSLPASPVQIYFSILEHTNWICKVRQTWKKQRQNYLKLSLCGMRYALTRSAPRLLGCQRTFLLCNEWHPAIEQDSISSLLQPMRIKQQQFRRLDRVNTRRGHGRGGSVSWQYPIGRKEDGFILSSLITGIYSICGWWLLLSSPGSGNKQQSSAHPL